MLRFVLWHLFLFSLPILMTLGWQLLFRKVRPSKVTAGIWALSALAGVVLMFVGLLFFRFQSGAPPDREYISPQLKDGGVVPGYFKEKPLQDSLQGEQQDK